MTTSSSTIAANTLGTLGAICWSIQLIPQIWINYRRQHTHGLQPTMMLLWASAGIPLGIYNIVRSFPIALQIQPQILTFLSLLTWTQTQYYPPARDQKPRSIAWCIAVLTIICALAGGIEAGITFALRTATSKRSEDQLQNYWPVVLMGALSALLLCAGVARHYVDIWKERTVRGISFVFVGIDALGDLTSLISVVFWWRAGRRLDVLGLVVYGSELVLWLGVFACGGWYNFRPWLKRKLQDQRSRRAEQQDAQNRSVNGQTEGTAPAERPSMDSRVLSTASHMSYATGTVFRTASGRTIIGPGTPDHHGGHGGLGDDAVRMRSIVQVEV